MSTRRFFLTVFGALLFVLAATPAMAQEVVVTGPPPELRKNLDALIKAFNSGNADQFEAMAKTTFTPDYFKRQTPAERKSLFTKLVADFGTIQFQQVERNGPDAPLEISVRGSVASGRWWIDLDESSRLDGLRAEVVKK